MHFQLLCKETKSLYRRLKSMHNYFIEGNDSSSKWNQKILLVDNNSQVNNIKAINISDQISHVMHCNGNAEKNHRTFL